MAGLQSVYLTFRLKLNEYGIEIRRVQEIIGTMNVTSVPGMPKYIRGVINLRGRPIPVIDLRLKLGMQPVKDAGLTSIIVLEIRRDSTRRTMGIIVDEISKVRYVTLDQIEPASSFGTRVDTDCILGLGKVGQNAFLLLDIDKVLSDEVFDLGDLISGKAAQIDMGELQ